MDFEEKMRLAEAIHTLPPHRLAEIVSIVARSVEPREEIEIDIDLLSQDVLLEIKRVVDDEKISTEPASRGATD